MQLLQLVHGRTDPSLRSPSTLDALAALASGGYVGRDDGANLAASYRFLRLLEHRLQLQRLRRTHLLPAEDDTDALRWLARAAQAAADGRHDVVGVLLDEWRRNARRVRRLHEKLFYRPLLDSVSRAVAGAGLSPEAANARLAALGWVSPEGALGHLRSLTGGVSRAAAIQQTLLPVLLDELARTPDPDRGLLAYRRVSEALADDPLVPAAAARRGAVAERLMTCWARPRWSRTCCVRAPRSCGCSPRTSAGQRDELIRDPAEVGGDAAHDRRPAARPGTPPRRPPGRPGGTRCCGSRARTCSGKLDVEEVCSGAVLAVGRGAVASTLAAAVASARRSDARRPGSR